MKSNIRTTETFYHNLGKLFYAVAAADQHVHEDEIKALREHVKDYWLAYDDLEDAFQSDAAYQIEVVFEGVQFLGAPSEEMYQDFVAYKREQPHLFTPEVKKLILETCRSIAHSFAGLNKSESIILSKLEMELIKNKTHSWNL